MKTFFRAHNNSFCHKQFLAKDLYHMRKISRTDRKIRTCTIRLDLIDDIFKLATRMEDVQSYNQDMLWEASIILYRQLTPSDKSELGEILSVLSNW